MVLAGGSGTRLKPFTTIHNKHTVLIFDKMLIQFPVFCAKQGNINEIMLVSSQDHVGDFLRLFGSGSEWGVDFAYKIQDTANGIAGAVSLGKTFVGDDHVMVILGDNIFANGIKSSIEKYRNIIKTKPEKAMCVLHRVPNPSEYGVVSFTDEEETKIHKITEKPKYPDSSCVVVGAYFFPPNVFDKITKCNPSNRGEYEIVDVLNLYLQEDNLEYDVYDGLWMDCGTPSRVVYAAVELQNMIKAGTAIF
jgi:glucose-1-phosphate thymidylyltransferase